MKVRPLIFALLCLATGHIGAQEPYQMKGNDSKIEADFLFSYYQQDGDHAAVTGGIGTEQLHDIAGLLVVNIPIDTFHALNISLGVDQYSSASTDRIDNHMSSASSGDMRTYANALFTRKNLSKGETYGIGLGFSTEFDYTLFPLDSPTPRSGTRAIRRSASAVRPSSIAGTSSTQSNCGIRSACLRQTGSRSMRRPFIRKC